MHSNTANSSPFSNGPFIVASISLRDVADGAIANSVGFQGLVPLPVKARRLQDGQKLKKYVPIHKQGDVCPNGVPALVEGKNNADDLDSE